MQKPELLAPAGDLEKMKIAFAFGADACYCGGMRYGLRERSGNFSAEELTEAVRLAHRLNKRIYITVNSMPHNEALDDLPAYLQQLESLGVDALIISDPGVLQIAKQFAPHTAYHLSTQANTVNYRSAQFWQQQGFSRLILARELSLQEIAVIRQNCSAEIECFVHGAMCMSYSGRCLISNFLTGRNANTGDCTQPCRWRYHLLEAKRPGEYFPVNQDENGTTIFYSRDLCMIEHLPELIHSGVHGLKIEGRMKSLHYVATVTGVYRRAIDLYCADPEHYRYDPQWLQEIEKTGTRAFTTGFYFGKPGAEAQSYTGEPLQRAIDFVGIVRKRTEQGVWLEQRNHFSAGDRLEILLPDMQRLEIIAKDLLNQQGQPITTAPHAQMMVFLPMVQPVPVNSLLRLLKS
ncbi:MAG: U32 family peptidase [Negativicutes bacterium]|nr:U32 family peptidase [Negativicutes bacterium]